ncbi:MAG: hypothetical protein JNL90_06090 [Planctomycetes bacterium]|nr:hypothetical protein [Planctomycetota bacterium]
MSATQELLLVLAAIALWEALLAVPRRAVVLRAWIGRRYAAVEPAELLGNERLGLLLAPLLPPLGRVHVTLPFRIALDERGAVVLDAQGAVAAEQRRLPFDGRFAPRADGNDLQLAGVPPLRCDTPDEAAAAARELVAFAALPAGERAAERARRLAAALDVAAAGRALADYEAAAPLLRLACNLAFLFWAIALPVVALTIGFEASWPWLLLAVALLGALVIATWVRAHRRLHPTRGAERRRAAVAFALAPLQAVRAIDALGRPLLARFHPVAAALALLPRPAAQAALARELRAALHPLVDPTASDEAAATARDFAAAWSRALRDAARQHGFAEEVLLAPPQPLSDAERRYCPRCHAQYGAAASECGDCRGVPLANLPAA